MKTLLCLLSDQHVPNLLSVHHFKPDRLVLVESEGMRRKNAGAHLLAALRFGCKGYDSRCDVVSLDDENSPSAMRACLDTVLQAWPATAWIVNLTGGTKPMSIGAYDFFRDRDARLVYMSIDRPNQFLDFRDGAAETCDYRPGIREFVAGYGFEFSQRPGFVKACEDRARGRWGLSRQIAEQSGGRPLMVPSFFKRHSDNRRGCDIEVGKSDFAVTGDLLAALVRELRLGDGPRCTVNYDTAAFLTGGWLETFFWGLIERRGSALGLWDVHLDLVLRPVGAQDGNEYDVAFIRNYTLFGLECKSGQQMDDRKFNVLYKVEATMRQFRALRVQSLVATTADHVLDATGRIKRHLARRAEAFNCRILPRPAIEQLAREADSADSVREILFPGGR